MKRQSNFFIAAVAIVVALASMLCLGQDMSTSSQWEDATLTMWSSTKIATSSQGWRTNIKESIIGFDAQDAPGHGGDARQGLGERQVVRRAPFDAVGGFQEELACHELWELAIRLLRGGARVAPMTGHTVAYRPAESPLWQRSLERDRHLPSVLAVVRAHRAAFAANVVASLAGRERRVAFLGERHREAEARRDARRREIATLDEEIRSLSEQLRARGLDGGPERHQREDPRLESHGRWLLSWILEAPRGEGHASPGVERRKGRKERVLVGTDEPTE